MNILHSTLSTWRDRLAPVSRTSTFRNTGQITPEEFVLAGDYLVYKFPTWSWADASSPAKRVSYLPDGKQFLVTRGVPCHRRLNDNFAGDAGLEDEIVRDMLSGEGPVGDNGDDGWLRTGGVRDVTADCNKQEALSRDVRTVDESGNVGEQEEDEEIPDMEDDDDDEEAIIREPTGQAGTTQPLRTYTLYITYANFYRTPRLYLSGYLSPSEPLPPHLMMEDIVGDYKDKTVTLEDFPWFDGSVKMATVHPCRHAAVMKIMLDRADAALKLRRDKLRQAETRDKANQILQAGGGGLAGLVDDTKGISLADHSQHPGGDEWEVLQHDEEEQVAIRVDQYLVVFLKFIASVTPGIEHDFTMGV